MFFCNLNECNHKGVNNFLFSFHRNWVNEHLPQDQRVHDLSTDLCTGVRLCILVESLQGRPMRPSYNKRPMNQHQYLENVTAALNAIEKDGVKLVNIGKLKIYV